VDLPNDSLFFKERLGVMFARVRLTQLSLRFRFRPMLVVGLMLLANLATMILIHVQIASVQALPATLALSLARHRTVFDIVATVELIARDPAATAAANVSTLASLLTELSEQQMALVAGLDIPGSDTELVGSPAIYSSDLRRLLFTATCDEMLSGRHLFWGPGAASAFDAAPAGYAPGTTSVALSYDAAPEVRCSSTVMEALVSEGVLATTASDTSCGANQMLLAFASATTSFLSDVVLYLAHIDHQGLLTHDNNDRVFLSTTIDVVDGALAQFCARLVSEARDSINFARAAEACLLAVQLVAICSLLVGIWLPGLRALAAETALARDIVKLAAPVWLRQGGAGSALRFVLGL
jgi:hypothetical protein